MPICAYCNEDKKLTREHVVPSFLYAYQKRYGQVSGWNEKNLKMVGGELKIRDVCEHCNNVVLGKLDSYGQSFLQSNGILTQCFLLKTLTLEYDYNLLLRWLLKLTYNSARAANNSPKIFEKYIPFILNCESPINKRDIFLFAKLMKPETYTGEQLDDAINKKLPVSKNGEINPFLCRLSWTPSPDESYIIKVIIIGALVFYIMVFIQDIKSGYREAKIRKYISGSNIFVKLDVNKKVINIPVSDDTFMDYYKFQVSRGS